MKFLLGLVGAGAGALLLAGAVVVTSGSHALPHEVPTAVAPVSVQAVRPVDDGRIDHSAVRNLPVESDDEPGRSVAAYDR